MGLLPFPCRDARNWGLRLGYSFHSQAAVNGCDTTTGRESKHNRCLQLILLEDLLCFSLSLLCKGRWVYLIVFERFYGLFLPVASTCGADQGQVRIFDECQNYRDISYEHLSTL